MDVPSAEIVASALRRLGGKTDAVTLCRSLEDAGYTTLASQLGMQRATDSGGPLIIMRDWQLALRSRSNQVVEEGDNG